MSLTLTEDAAEFLARRLDSSPLADGAGLRIWGMFVDDELVLACNFTEGPTGSDEVVVAAGARIFLDAEVAPHLGQKTISIRTLDDRVALVVVDDWWPEGESPLG